MRVITRNSVSDALANAYNLNVYHVDDYWDSHKQRSNPDEHPTYHAISHITGDDLWLRPLPEQIETEPQFVREALSFILEDVETLLSEDNRPLIVDASVVPEDILTYLPSKNHIFYLIPTEAWQRHHYALRESIKPTLAKTSNPELAWERWQSRDAAYARWLLERVKEAGLPYIEVDGGVSLQATVELVSNHFSLM